MYLVVLFNQEVMFEVHFNFVRVINHFKTRQLSRKRSPSGS